MSQAISSGVVLAGGRSSRMGRDKAQLPLPDGSCFLERALHLLRQLPLAQVLVSGNCPGGIADPVPGMGPLGGLYGVARAVDTQGLLVVPVDMPLLSVELLSLLLDEGERSGCACYFGDYYFPLWLPLTEGVREFLQAAAGGSGASSIGALLRFAGARKLELPDDPDSFSNINTPAEYAANYSEKFLHSIL